MFLSRLWIFFCLAMLVCFNLEVCLAEQSLSDRLRQTSSEKTPAEQKIELARKAIESNPTSFEAHVALAWALAKRARETSEPDYYEQATTEVNESLRLSPDNFEARKAETWIALGQHEFQRALQLARELNKRRPDDVLVYSLLTDACIETGNYDEAEQSAQWALDMRPGEISALTRAAYLRELFGDIPGAVELMQSAYLKTPATEVEDRAWLLTQFAHLQMQIGKPHIADMAIADALKTFPNYHYALGTLVRIRTAQARLDEAIEVARAFYLASPHPENLFVVAEALVRGGKEEEATDMWKEFEVQALDESSGPDNANRELIYYYVNHANRKSDALRIATEEMERRKDLFTRSAFAWALYANGKFGDAQREMEQALAVGIRDPQLLYQAGMITMKNGDASQAESYLRQSILQAGQSNVSDLVKRELEDLSLQRNERSKQELRR